jgi:hypothetical protein
MARLRNSRKSTGPKGLTLYFIKPSCRTFSLCEMGVNWDEEGVLPRSCRNLEVNRVAVSVESGLVDSFGECRVSVNGGVDIINRSFK